MIEEIKQDNNCIVKAFENNPIAILHENNDTKKVYYFKASDIGNALGIVNIRTTIQNYEDEDERVVRKVYDPQGTPQNTIFLSSQGVYRLLYNSKKEIAKKFRKWAGNILDDIIFNESVELKKQLEEKEKKHQKELEEKDKQLEYTKNELQKMSICRIKKWYNVEPGDSVYAFKNDGQPYIKIGKAEDLKKRENAYTVGNRTSNIFYYRKCYNCKLTEKVINHILDKYRLQTNREWFDISDELAIYTIDIVCDFLDSYIHCSEELINLKIKEQLSICLDRANEIKKKNESDEITDEVTKDNTTQNKEKDDVDKNKKQKNNICIIEDQADPIKTHLDKFVKEFCVVGDDKKCLALDILGAYRIWNKKTDPHTKKNLMNYMKKNYSLRQDYVHEHRTKFNYYIGIQPRDFIIKRSDESQPCLPYEEFILSECKFAYTHRTTKTILFNEFKKWISNKYPEYIFSKNEQTNMESYLNITFLNCKKIHINGGTNGYYGLQMKSDPTEQLGISLSRRKMVYKIYINTGEIVETYNSLYEASHKVDIDEAKLSYLILNNIIINNQFIYTYDSEWQRW